MERLGREPLLQTIRDAAGYKNADLDNVLKEYGASLDNSVDAYRLSMQSPIPTRQLSWCASVRCGCAVELPNLAASIVQHCLLGVTVYHPSACAPAV